jgi:hypothetical protein
MLIYIYILTGGCHGCDKGNNKITERSTLGSLKMLTLIWKWTIQRLSQPNFISFGLVVTEEKMFLHQNNPYCIAYKT